MRRIFGINPRKQNEQTMITDQALFCTSYCWQKWKHIKSWSEQSVYMQDKLLLPYIDLNSRRRRRLHCTTGTVDLSSLVSCGCSLGMSVQYNLLICSIHWCIHPLIWWGGDVVGGFSAVRARLKQPGNQMTIAVAPASIAQTPICHIGWNSKLELNKFASMSN